MNIHSCTRRTDTFTIWIESKPSLVCRKPKAAHTQLGPCCVSFLQSFIRCAPSCASRCAAKSRQLTLTRRKTSYTESSSVSSARPLQAYAKFASWHQQRALPALQFQAHPAVRWPHAFPRPYTSAWSVSPFQSVLPSFEVCVSLAALGPAGMVAELLASSVCRSLIM